MHESDINRWGVARSLGLVLEALMESQRQFDWNPGRISCERMHVVTQLWCLWLEGAEYFTMAQLSERVKVSSSTLYRWLLEMCERGLIRPVLDPDDSRVVRYYMEVGDGPGKESVRALLDSMSAERLGSQVRRELESLMKR